MLSKFINKSAPKISIFSSKASFERGLLGLLFLTSCAPSSATIWQQQTIDSEVPCSRYYIPAQDPLKNMQIEWHGSNADAPLYLNVYGPALTPDANQTIQVLISIDNQVSAYHARLLEGNQRILLPIDAKEKLLDALQIKKPVTIKVGRYTHTIP